MGVYVMVGYVKIEVPDILFDETNYIILTLLLTKWLIWFVCMSNDTKVITICQAFFVRKNPLCISSKYQETTDST